ncbi:hypothetical protein CCR75_003883 [Bremia lactucae]|uniref:Uncharacterized protein n=1 Tax=Bremia lactucae TaxID=4779 RepID=A0A976IIS8_BRELC|nr:hypothetical protein CCR75_003883 [Bremia lactucae]
MHATGRPHVKVMAYDNITVLKTGRVLGPKPSFKHTASGKKIGRKSRACRQTKAIKTPRTMVENTSVSLEHKLDLPLDALVDANNIGSHKSKRRRTSS